MSEPLHILYVLHSLGRGGMENGVVNLLNRIDAERFRFTVVLMEKERSMLDRVERPGVRVETVRRRWGNDPAFAAGVWALCRRERPDVVHTRGFSAIEGIAAARLAGVGAVVHSEHGRDVTEAAGMKRRRAWARSLLFRLANRVVTVSEELRTSLLSEVRVPGRKVRCIPNGVDLSRFDRGRARERVRRELGIPADAPVLGTVGRHDPVKDYASLVRAFAVVRARHANARLVLCGDGPEAPALRSLAESLGVADSVHFPGFRDDVPDVLASFDVFCLTSVTEGMSNAILEAMASRLPCVATDVGGNGELLSHGTTGYLTPPRDPAAFADAVLRLVDDPVLRTAAGQASRRRVEQKFSLDGMVRCYEDLYFDLATGVVPPRPASSPDERSRAQVPESEKVHAIP